MLIISLINALFMFSISLVGLCILTVIVYITCLGDWK